MEPLKIQIEKKVHLCTPIIKLLPAHPAKIQLSDDDCSSHGKLHEQIYLHDQAIVYLPGLHISRATDIKMVADRVCPHLPVWDIAKKK